MAPSKLVQRIKRECQKIEPAAWALARAIFEKPETAYQEVFASRVLTDFLAGHGFTIANNLGGLKTAFTAERRASRRPCLAYLAEMDALPGMGHACGHHLIAASSAGAAAALGRALGDDLRGSIKVIGCPAEEMGGGKVVLAREGAFKDLDAALIIHPDRRTEVYKRALGVVEIELRFKGRAAHASAEPEKGVNALDAVIQTFNAVNALRQQLPSHVRVHGIVTQGGVAPNIIPERAAAVFLARGLTIQETNEVAAKVIACAQGAAKSAGARLVSRIKKDKFYAPYAGNRALGEVFRRVLESIGVEIKQGPEDEGMGSTDVGNVGLHAPVLHPLLAVPGVASGVHSQDFAVAAGGPGGRAMLGKAILANALTGAEVLSDERLREAIAKEHREYIKHEGRLPDYL